MSPEADITTQKILQQVEGVKQRLIALRMNKSLNPDIETVFLPTDKKYFLLRSSSIKELAMLNADISEMVPPLVVEALREKLQKA